MSKMVKLYCLINPFTNEPFYIGATTKPLIGRLMEHAKEHLSCSESRRSIKMNYIKSLSENGRRPKIALLCFCSVEFVDELEKRYYNLFVEIGYKMVQNKHLFNYSKTAKTRHETARYYAICKANGGQAAGDILPIGK